MARDIQLRVLQPFSCVFGGVEQDFFKNQLINAEVARAWPQGTLNRRLKNGFLEFVADDEVAALLTGDEDDTLTPVPAPAPSGEADEPPAPVVEGAPVTGDANSGFSLGN